MDLDYYYYFPILSQSLFLPVSKSLRLYEIILIPNYTCRVELCDHVAMHKQTIVLGVATVATPM